MARDVPLSASETVTVLQEFGGSIHAICTRIHGISTRPDGCRLGHCGAAHQAAQPQGSHLLRGTDRPCTYTTADDAMLMCVQLSKQDRVLHIRAVVSADVKSAHITNFSIALNGAKYVAEH